MYSRLQDTQMEVLVSCNRESKLDGRIHPRPTRRSVLRNVREWLRNARGRRLPGPFLAAAATSARRDNRENVSPCTGWHVLFQVFKRTFVTRCCFLVHDAKINDPNPQRTPHQIHAGPVGPENVEFG